MGKWIDIKSTNIKRVSYYENDLYVEFSSGAQYQYFNVPEEVFDELLTAESAGRFLNIEIKGKYTHELTRESDKKDLNKEQGTDTKIPTVQETDGSEQDSSIKRGCTCSQPCSKRSAT